MSVSAKDKGNQNFTINPEVTTKLVGSSKRQGAFYCTCCGTTYTTQQGNFLKSNSPLYNANNHFLPFCKDCANDYYERMLGFYDGNEAHAIEHCCRLFDWYYSPDIVDMVNKNTKGYSDISLYSSKMNLPQFRNKGKATYKDTIAENPNPSIVTSVTELQPEDISPEVAATSDEPVVEQRWIEHFGGGFAPAEYQYMQNEYDDWVARYDCSAKAYEVLVLQMCRVEVTAQRCLAKGDIKGYNDAIKTLQDLMGSANFKPNQTKDNTLVDQNTFGTLIDKWEHEAPIMEPLPEWKDVDGIVKYIRTYYFGHMCNVLHLRNDYADEYQEEIGKYTVTPPVYDDDEDTTGSAIFDKYSTKGGKDDDTGDSDDLGALEEED